VFMAAGIVGALTIATLCLGLRSAPRESVVIERAGREPLLWRALDLRLRAFLVAIAVVSAATVPEALIVLWATEHGIRFAWIPVLWALAHAVKALVAWPCGELADRFGPMRVLAFGWPLRVAALLALSTGEPGLAGTSVLFVMYSGSLAVTEAAERALVAAVAPREVQGTAYGWFHLLAGLGALPGAWFIGQLWQSFGSRSALLAAAALGSAACAAAAMLAVRTGTFFRARSTSGG
jgi:MFS-type transporter involved in bile tolerance (Atg22 family)